MSAFGKIVRGEPLPKSQPAVNTPVAQLTSSQTTPPPSAMTPAQVELVQAEHTALNANSSTTPYWLAVAVAVVILMLGMMPHSPLWAVITAKPVPPDMVTSALWVTAHHWVVSTAAWLRWVIVAGVCAYLHLVRTHFGTRRDDLIANMFAGLMKYAYIAAMLSFILSHK